MLECGRRLKSSRPEVLGPKGVRVRPQRDAGAAPVRQRSLPRWTRRFQLDVGGLDAALWVLQPAVETTTPPERISELCFDEMSCNSWPTMTRAGCDP